MFGHHKKSEEREQRTEYDEESEAPESAAEIQDDSLFETPEPIGSKEYVDLELARINPMM